MYGYLCYRDNYEFGIHDVRGTVLGGLADYAPDYTLLQLIYNFGRLVIIWQSSPVSYELSFSKPEEPLVCGDLRELRRLFY